LPFTTCTGAGQYTILARRNLEKLLIVYTITITRSKRITEHKAFTNLQITKAEPETVAVFHLLCPLSCLPIVRIPNVADILKVILLFIEKAGFLGVFVEN
jgi:hypothetical protein